jgi:uncharacterized protein (TIGR03435 family)
MKIMRSFLVLAAATLPLRAQSPTFEVATVKRNVSGSTSASNRALPGGRVTITNNTLRNIIRNFHRIQPYQLIGGPDWLSTERWDIVAKAEGDLGEPFLSEQNGQASRAQLMLQSLLADRFKLVVHTEAHEHANLCPRVGERRQVAGSAASSIDD